MRLVGLSFLTVIAATGGLGQTVIAADELRADLERTAAQQQIEVARGHRRFVQENRAALVARVAAGPAAIALSELQPRFLDPRFPTSNALGQPFALAATAALDGEPVGYVYLRPGGAGTPKELWRVVQMGLGESAVAGVDSGRRRFVAALGASLPAPAEAAPILSTAQLRDAASRALLSRFREPDDPSATTMAATLDGGGARLGNIGALAGRDLRATVATAGSLNVAQIYTPQATVTTAVGGATVTYAARTWRAGAPNGATATADALNGATAAELLSRY